VTFGVWVWLCGIVETWGDTSEWKMRRKNIKNVCLLFAFVTIRMDGMLVKRKKGIRLRVISKVIHG